MSMVKWHRLLGLLLRDFFLGTPYKVEMEEDLSTRSQFLDIAILHDKPGELTRTAPVGLGELGLYNLLTYKSIAEPLSSWALDELLGHFVNYRKLLTPTKEPLCPCNWFRLFAVCTRFPRDLAGQFPLTAVEKGVYEVGWGGRIIRVIVLNEVEKSERNALWHLFSGIPEQVQYGAEQYQWQQKGVKTMLRDLFVKYRVEGVEMSYSTNDYLRELAEEFIQQASPEDRAMVMSHVPVPELEAVLRSHETECA